MSQLRTAGIEPAAEAFYRDHHAYTEQDIRDLLNLRQRSEADGFVTTEKDAVNLGGFLVRAGAAGGGPGQDGTGGCS